MLTTTKEIKVNSYRGKPGYVKDMYTDGIQTTVKLFGVPVYRYTNTVKRVDENPQPATADDKKYKVPKKVLIIQEDMKHVAVAIRGDNRSEPTKWEVLRAAFVLLRYLSKGKGLSRNFFTNTLALFRAASWKASHVPSGNDTATAPEPPTSHSDTECRPPQSGQTSSQHSCSMERNT